MPKKYLSLLISLLFTSILATTVTETDEKSGTPPTSISLSPSHSASVSARTVSLDYEALEKKFDELKSYDEWHLFNKIRKILGSILTLPSTIVGDPVEETIEFFNKLVDYGSDYLEHEIDIVLNYQIFTPYNAHEGFYLENSLQSFHRSSFDSRLDTKFLIHGFGIEFDNDSIIFDIKDKILQKGDFNVIVVDWNRYNGFPYNEAAVGAAFAGIEVAKLVQSLITSYEITSNSVHLIGSGLGSHVASFTGKLIPNIGRITALDVTGLVFDYLPSHMRLTETDADFVDVIHTYGTSDISGGLGTLSPYGHIDFYPNGGSLQPGCSYGDLYVEEDKQLTFIEEPIDIIFCNHQRALHLFLKSFDDCWFYSVHCESYEDFKNEKCSYETSLTARMGFYATPIPSLPPNSKFYLQTSGKAPFCIH